MPSRDWRISIRDILQSIGGIERRMASMTFEEFQGDETVCATTTGLVGT